MRKFAFKIIDIQTKLPQDINIKGSRKKILHDTFNQIVEGANNLDLIFQHTVNNKNYSLSIQNESEGTKTYFGLAGLLDILIKNSTLITIDELESSLHPDLFEHFILTFLENAKSSQLIATTHNREILNNNEMFRNDAIWLTDKSKNSATELYALSDFNSNIIRKQPKTNILNAYKSGKLGAVPHLGDTFLDL